MDLTQIPQLLEDETNTFRQNMRATADQYNARLMELKRQVFETVRDEKSREISEEEFSAALDTLGQISSNTHEILQRAGFSDQSTADWLSKKLAPPADFRRPLLQIIVLAVLDDFAETKLRDELQQLVREWNSETDMATVRVSAKASLERTLDELGVLKELSLRVRNCIINDGVVTLGDALVKNEAEWLRTPNFGRKSLNELNEALTERFGVKVGCLTGTEREQYEGVSNTRENLEWASGMELSSQWDSNELKPEFKNMGYEALQNRMGRGEEVYIKTTADPELMEALKKEGITYKTELATAPQSVIDRICAGRDDRRKQLVEMLKSSSWKGLQLQTKVPSHLKSRVRVYQEKNVGK